MTPIKRNALTLQEKVTILNYCDENTQIKNQKQLAADLQLPVSTLRTILKNRKEIIEKCMSGGLKRKRQKAGKFDNLEKDLVKWFHQAKVLKLPINGPILCEKARKIAKSLQLSDFKTTSGWIDRFKKRHGIVYSQIREKTKTMVEQDVDIIDKWMTTLPALLQNYEPQNIFNADEFGLYFKLTPDEPYVSEGKTPLEGKASKEKVTVLVCANSNGTEKIRLVVIGKEKDPYCFKNVRTLPVMYDTQSQACMTSLRFGDWLKTLDEQFQMQSRQIILFIDTCSAHPKDVELRNIKLVFFPPNAKRILNPMDQGIIKVLKQGYRTRFLQCNTKEMADVGCDRPANVQDVILNIAAAWEEIEPETIQGSFEKAGFRNYENNIVLKVEAEPEILQNFSRYISVNDNIAKYEARPFENFIENANSTQNSNPSDDDDYIDKSIPILTNAQALSAVGDLRRYLSYLDDNENALQMLNYIESLVITNVTKYVCETIIND